MDIFRVPCSGGVEQKLTISTRRLPNWRWSTIARCSSWGVPRPVGPVPLDPGRADGELPARRRVRTLHVGGRQPQSRARRGHQDGTHVAALARADLRRGEQAVEADAAPYDVGTTRALAPRYADNDGVYFLSGLGPSDGLWSFKDGERQEIIKGEDRNLFEPTAASGDGRVAVVYKNPQGKHRLIIQSITGGSQPLSRGLLDVFGVADWSPDGTTIAVGGPPRRRPSSRSLRDRCRWPGPGELKPIKECDCSNPVWSPDGEFIVYSERFSGQADLRAVRPDGSNYPMKPLKVSPGGYRFRDGCTSSTCRDQNRPTSRKFDLITGTSRQLTRLGNKGTLQGFDMAPDGKHILFDRTQRNSNLVVIYFNPERNTPDR